MTTKNTAKTGYVGYGKCCKCGKYGNCGKCGKYGKQGGFALIEFIIAIAVMALIVSFLVPALTDYRQRIVEVERTVSEDTINKAIRQCYALEGRYPPVSGETGLDYLKDFYGVMLKPQDFVYDYRIVDGVPYLTVTIRE